VPRSRAPGTCTRELTVRKPGATTAFTPIPAAWSIATATPTGTGLHHRNGSRHPAQQSSRNQDTTRSTNPISRELAIHVAPLGAQGRNLAAREADSPQESREGG
jgi:hypothetical protein